MTMRIHAVNAAEGDCILLESDGRFALIDGGISGNYAANVQPYLAQIVGAGGQLEAVVVSHIDADHITGILDLFADIERARADGEPHPPVRVVDLWHNSFGTTLETAKGALFANLQAMMSQAGRANIASANGSIALLGIAQGARLQRVAIQLGIPVNQFFGGGRITQEAAVGQRWSLGSADFVVAGPTVPNLQELQADWIKWIENNMDAFALGDTQAMANADKSVPNLSSIVLFGTTPSGDVLLTGDARGDHILQGLEQSGAIKLSGKHPLRLLKVPHHGSDRNVAQNFFERLPADIYVLSANGKYGNPDQDVLAMIVDVAKADQRNPLIVVTNEAPSLDWLRQNRPSTQFDYTLVVRDQAKRALVIDLTTGTAT